MDESFKRALQKIPVQLGKRPGARFTVILNGQKKPEGKNWAGPNGANYGIEDAPLAGYLSAGHNYGVLCGHAGITVADLDDPARLMELGIIDKIPNTMQVKTGRGGLHVYLDCSDLDHQIGLYHPTLKEEDGEPLHLGEIQSLGQQVVGANSIHPNGNKYELINDVPIIKISKVDLLKVFDGLILTGVDDPEEEPRMASERRSRAGGSSSIGDLIPIDQVAWPKRIVERRGSEVIGTHPLHGSKYGKNFSVNTDKNCWHCFRCGPPGEHRGGGGPLEWLAVEAGLISCKDAKPGCLDDKELFKKVLQIARDKGFNIPIRPDLSLKEEAKKEPPIPKGPTVMDALKELIDHEDKIKGDCTWEWRMYKSRAERVLKDKYISAAGEEKAHKFLKKFKIVLKELGIDYDNLYPLLLNPKGNKEEFSDEIKTKAMFVLENNNPVEFVVGTCGRMVLGAETAFKKLTCCVSVQNVNQSAGLHPKLTGKSSGGKTWTVYGFAHHLPSESVVKGSMSSKAGFYHKDGDRVFRILDDYMSGNEDTDTVIKQTTSEFHETYTHRTVVKQVGVSLEIGREQTWAITSVNNDEDIQVLNRGIPINVDDSVKLTQTVNNRTVRRYGEGERQKPVDEKVLICRAIFQILRDAGYINVRIPFWERIEWMDTSNRRNPSIFMDLVIAHTAMFRYQRQVDSEGYYLATEDDFNAAKALFTDNDGEELVKRLTRRERDVLVALVATPEGLTRDDISEKLGIAPQQVSQILGGRNGQGGLLQKVTIKETKMSEMMKINEEQSRTVHKIVYSLKDYDRFAGFDAIVRLKPKVGNNDESKDESKGNESNRHDEVIVSKNKNKIEDNKARAFVPEGNKKFHAGENDAFVAFVKDADSENDAFAEVFHDDDESIWKKGLNSIIMNRGVLNPFMLACRARDAFGGKGNVSQAEAFLRANGYEEQDGIWIPKPA